MKIFLKDNYECWLGLRKLKPSFIADIKLCSHLSKEFTCSSNVTHYLVILILHIYKRKRIEIMFIAPLFIIGKWRNILNVHQVMSGLTNVILLCSGILTSNEKEGINEKCSRWMTLENTMPCERILSQKTRCIYGTICMKSSKLINL
jgi:hypothetical protein